jgi:prephenate dehydrogenase
VPEETVAAVLGLESAGAALASALRRAALFAAVIGWDPDFDTARAARRQDVADRYVKRAPEAAQQAGAVFVALRGEPFAEVLRAIGPHLRPGAVVCSILEAHEPANALAGRTLPASVSFVSADPIAWHATAESAPAGTAGTAGSAGSARPGGPGGSAIAVGGAFEGGVWCIAPAAAAHEDAVGFVAHVGERLGMAPFFLDAREHDALTAGLSGLPAVLAAALMRVVTKEPSWREMSRLAGAPFRAATAPLAAIQPAEQQAMLAGSREHLARWLDGMIEELRALRDGLRQGSEPADYFQQASETRARWLAEREVPVQAAELPRVEAPRRRFPF